MLGYKNDLEPTQHILVSAHSYSPAQGVIRKGIFIKPQAYPITMFARGAIMYLAVTGPGVLAPSASAGQPLTYAQLAGMRSLAILRAHTMAGTVTISSSELTTTTSQTSMATVGVPTQLCCMAGCTHCQNLDCRHNADLCNAYWIVRTSLLSATAIFMANVELPVVVCSTTPAAPHG